MKMKQS